MAAPSGAAGAFSFRRRVFVLYTAGGLLAIAAVVVRSPVPLFAALTLLLAPAAAALDRPRGASSARLTWRSTGEASTVDVTGEIVPGPGLSVPSLDVVFVRPEPLVEARPSEIRAEAGKIVFHHHWKAPFPCLVEVPVPRIAWSDPLGLSQSSIDVEGQALAVERFPPEVARVGSLRLRRTTLLPGETRSRAVGAAGEFFAVRAAAPGDTPKQINWKATARRGRMLSNDYHMERTGDLLLLLDLRPSSLGEERDRKLLAISRAAAMGIASGFLEEKSRVGLALFDEFVTAVPMGTGRLQRYRISQALSSATLGRVSGPSERFAVSLRRYFPSGVTTLLLSPLHDDDSMILLPHLRRRGFAPFVLSPSPIPLLTVPPDRAGPDDEVAARLLRLVRRERIQQGWREAPVVEWDDYWSLAPLVNFLSAPTRNRRSS